MIQRLGDTAARIARAIIPDPFVLALLLTLLTWVLCVALTPSGPWEVLAFWGDEQTGLWQSKLLTFAFQMCIILVTGHALASAPPVQRLIVRLASIPRNSADAAALVGFVAMAASLMNWGLGLIVGALLAREVGRCARANGRAIHYPLVVAAGYTGMLVWHGGLSGSAPLQATSLSDLAGVLGEANALACGPLPLTETLGSRLNLVVTALTLFVVPLLLGTLAPSSSEATVAAPDGPDTHSEAGHLKTETTGSPAEWLDRSFLMAALGFVPLLLALGLFLRDRGIGRLGLNQVNALFLALGLALHGSPRRYAAAVTEAARGTAGILLQFPFYFGILGMMAHSGLAEQFARSLAETSNATFYPVVTFASAAVLNLFVPSGGGQWAIQGPIVIEGALRLGVEPQRALMALCYGDQWTNMLQPFWALPLLAITGLQARDIIGYTCVVMLLTAPMFILPLLLI